MTKRLKLLSFDPIHWENSRSIGSSSRMPKGDAFFVSGREEKWLVPDALGKCGRAGQGKDTF